MIKYVLDERNLRSQKAETIARAKFMLQSLEPEIFQFLDTIPYAMINGEALSVTAYGDVGYRTSMDFDFLVSVRHSKAIKEIFFNHGYVEFLYDKEGNPRKPTRKEQIMLINANRLTAFEKLTDKGIKLSFDFNTDIFWGEYDGKKIDIDEFVADAETVDIHGFKIKMLTDVKCFIQTCLHHYNLMNSPFYLFEPRKIVLSECWFQDIYSLYINKICSKKSAIEKFVYDFELQDEFYYMLYYTSVIFQDEELYQFADTFKTESGVKKLEQFGLTDSERKIWPISFEERMNHPQLFKVLKPLMSESDLEKIIRNSTRSTYRMEMSTDYTYNPYYYEKERDEKAASYLKEFIKK